MSNQDQFWTCSECSHQYVIVVEHQPIINGYVDVGHECPMCHTWFHSYYTNEKLDQQRALLRKFFANAHKSVEHSKRYWRKKEQFATSHRLLQARVQGLLAHA